MENLWTLYRTTVKINQFSNDMLNPCFRPSICQYGSDFKCSVPWFPRPCCHCHIMYPNFWSRISGRLTCISKSSHLQIDTCGPQRRHMHSYIHPLTRKPLLPPWQTDYPCQSWVQMLWSGAGGLHGPFSPLNNINSYLSPLGKGEKSYPDLLALVIAVIVTIIVALGVKNSVGFNNVLNVLNLAVWAFIMIAGLFFINGKYWAEGQFLPHGWSGVSSLLKSSMAIAHSAFHLVASLRHIFKKMPLCPVIFMASVSLLFIRI